MSRWRSVEWGLDGLTRDNPERPDPQGREVLVKTVAASLNYRDLMVVLGQYNPKFPRPLVPGSDGFFEVVAVGPEAPSNLVGRMALSVFAPAWQDGDPTELALRSTLGGPRNGVFQTYGLYQPEELLFLEEPERLTPAQWATLPCAGVTAWTALFEHGKLRPGQTVVLLGTGGVSVFCLQLAKAAGARVLLLSSSEAKRSRVEELGADAVHDYRADPEWSKWVRSQTGGKGADLIVEVGGAGTLEQSLKAVKIGGRISLLGVLSGVESRLNILPLLMKAVNVQGLLVGHKRHARELVQAVLSNGIVPVVGVEFPERDLVEAFRTMQSAEHFAKISILW